MTLPPSEDPVLLSQQRFEDGLSGNYDFTIGGVLREAWQRTKGVKRTFLSAFLFMAVYITLISFLIGPSAGEPITILQTILLSISTAPLTGGFVMMGARRAVDLPISLSTLFAYVPKTWPIAFVSVTFALLDWSAQRLFGLMVSALLLAFITVFIAMTYYLIADRNLGPLAAVMASVRASLHRGFKLISLMLVAVLILLVSAIPLGLGLIWALPMLSIAYGIVYREMFGVQEAIQEMEAAAR